jgi:hypothetical protein
VPIYDVFGLRLWIDRPVAELSSVHSTSTSQSKSSVDVIVDCEPEWQEIHHRSTPREVIYVSQECVEAEKPALQVWRVGSGAFYHLAYSDGVQFLVREDGECIGVTWPQEAVFANVLPYLLGPVLGLVIRLRGGVCLHASAVAAGGHAALLVGPMGAGKSSTALAFAQLGCAVLSDDVSVLTHVGGSFSVQPGYPGLRVWPDMAQALLGGQIELPRVMPAWEKRRVDVVANGFCFRSTPTPIAAIYLLNERVEDASAPELSDIAPSTALLRLIANGYVRYLLDRPMLISEFHMLGQLVQHVPIRQATPHADPSRLPSLCEAILDDLSSL